MTKPKRQKAVIVDFDGTLCDVSAALPHIMTPGQRKDFKKFHEVSKTCPPIDETMHWCWVQKIVHERKIIVVTGRKKMWYFDTVKWLDEHMQVPFARLLMRDDQDDRPDTEVKRDLYDVLTKELDYEITAAIDDRPRIIELWESLGIPTTTVYNENWVQAGEHYKENR